MYQWAVVSQLILSALTGWGGESVEPSSGTIYTFNATSIDGEHVPMENYRGRAVLIVNVASE